MRQYKIWDKTETIYTPAGELLTPGQWLSRYPWANAPGAVPVVAAGPVNGGFMGELSMMRQLAERNGAVFDDGLADEALLEAIEEFETRPAPAEPSAEERTAAALEFLAMNSLPDQEVTA